MEISQELQRIKISNNQLPFLIDLINFMLMIRSDNQMFLIYFLKKGNIPEIENNGSDLQ